MTRSTSTLQRLIIGNLDCECDHARARLTRTSSSTSPDPFQLPDTVLRTIASASTILRSLASDDDLLWTPGPIEDHVLPHGTELPRPRLVSGPVDTLQPAARLVAWGETRSTEVLRTSMPENDGPSVTDRVADFSRPLHELIWDLPSAPARVVEEVNHRGFLIDIASTLGCALPGAMMVESIDELRSHLDSGGASASPHEQWILKAPCSAAGRWRCRGRGRWPLEPGTLRTIENLLARFDALLFEPWLERTEDFGCAALLTDDHLERVSFHRQKVDGQGRFNGLELATSRSHLGGLKPAEKERLLETIEGVASMLRARGFRGPFGIDCWRYQDAAGKEHFHPLGEINARMTFGLAARAVVERLDIQGSWSQEASITLHMKGDFMKHLPDHDTERRQLIPLVQPDKETQPTMALEVREPGARMNR